MYFTFRLSSFELKRIGFHPLLAGNLNSSKSPLKISHAGSSDRNFISKSLEESYGGTCNVAVFFHDTIVISAINCFKAKMSSEAYLVFIKFT